MNDEQIVTEAMANHDKHYWALVQTLKHKRKGWGELADLIGEGSTVAKAIWNKYENFKFHSAPAPAQGTPEPSKVEEIAKQIAMECYEHMHITPTQEIGIMKHAEAALRPYSPPASQTSGKNGRCTVCERDIPNTCIRVVWQDERGQQFVRHLNDCSLQIRNEEPPK